MTHAEDEDEATPPHSSAAETQAKAVTTA